MHFGTRDRTPHYFLQNLTMGPTSHLDLYIFLEPAARGAILPLAYSHSFHPCPKIKITPLLPPGYA